MLHASFVGFAYAGRVARLFDDFRRWRFRAADAAFFMADALMRFTRFHAPESAAPGD